MHSIKVAAGQNLYDIALQEYGSTEGVFLLLKDNEGLLLHSTLSVGQELIINSDPIIPEIVDYYKKQNWKPNSGTLNN